MDTQRSFFGRVKDFLFGKAIDLSDSRIFTHISLAAFFAWVGLGADGLSSSCYGPQEAFLALQEHTYLSIFVAASTVFTIFIISVSYMQIIELFPNGGGGYQVASKLLSPTLGMVSGCALMIDYVLTITVSIASGADAVFSFIPPEWHFLKLWFAGGVIILLIILNMRGVKESIIVLAPIFLLFIFIHVFVILYALTHHLTKFPWLVTATQTDTTEALGQYGLWGLMFVIFKAYSMGAGTYTGIEAISNAVPVLKEPKVNTAKTTMWYMAISLAFVVFGLMLGYLFYGVVPHPEKTLNAVLFERVTEHWGAATANAFIVTALISEAVILFVAAQTGFLGGPRILANMANDRWVPTRFAMLSDRLVMRDGLLIIGGGALLILIYSRGSLGLLIVLYSINVFITFVLSQLGMVRHWWANRHQHRRWFKGLLINGAGLILTTLILISMVFFKFFDGGWITLLITGAFIMFSLRLRAHYRQTQKLLGRLDNLLTVAENDRSVNINHNVQTLKPNYNDRTAVIFVSGYNGLGLHTLFNIIRYMGNAFKNYIFVQIAIVDAANFKDEATLKTVKEGVTQDLQKYVSFTGGQGFYTEAFSAVGTNIEDEAMGLVPAIQRRFPQAVFFGGQLSFKENSLLNYWLHNYTALRLQKRFYTEGIPFFVIPIRVE